MRKELVLDEAPMSTKKRKRLDAYIAKKLKQEEMHESLRIIAANALVSTSADQSHQIPTGLSTLGIKSTKTLGQFPTNPLSAIELAERREDLTVRKAMAGVPGGERKKGRRARKGAYENLDNEDVEDGSDEDDDMSGQDDEPVEEDERAVKKRKKAERNGIVVAAGSAGSSTPLVGLGKKAKVKNASGISAKGIKVCRSYPFSPGMY
jgi:ATP-dependent RNA helicase DHX37/DHR1